MRIRFDDGVFSFGDIREITVSDGMRRPPLHAVS